MERSIEFGDQIVHVQFLPETGESNFQYIIYDKVTKDAISIDCFNPERVLEFIGSKNLTLAGALATHHHWDHTGGIKKLARENPKMSVIGGDDRVPCLTKKISNDEFEVGSFQIKSIFTPCHTTGSVCYYFSTLQSVFTGDTIFCAGAGRFFEGNGEMMVKAFDAIFQLPDETLLFPGHDYNLSNLKFAKKLEPNNNEINLMLEKFENLDSVSKLATSLGDERNINPFARFRVANMRNWALKKGAENDGEVMQLIRESKNSGTV